MVHIVVVAPPPDAQSAEDVGDRDSPQTVDPPVARQLRVTRVVRDERDLVPERAEERPCDGVIERARRARVRERGERGKRRVDDQRRRITRNERRRRVEPEIMDPRACDGRDEGELDTPDSAATKRNRTGSGEDRRGQVSSAA